MHTWLSRSPWSALLILWLATVVAYASSFGGTFVFDDHDCILNNAGLRSTASLWEPFEHGVPTGLFRRDFIRSTLVFNHLVSGYETWSYHLVNLLVHLSNGTLLFLLVRGTCSLSGEWPRGQSTVVAFVASLLWLVHPLQTQSVTYIIQRCESMSSFWYLLVLYCLMKTDVDVHRYRWQILGSIAMLFGVASKEIIVTVPFVVVAYDWTFLQGSLSDRMRKRWLLYIGLLVGMLAFLLNYEIYSQYAQNTRQSWSTNYRPWPAASRWEYLSSQPSVILHYLTLAVFPVNQCFDYAWEIERSPVKIFGNGLIILSLLAFGGYLLYRRSGWGFLIVSFFFILAPSSSIKPLELAFEHRMYLALACLTVAASVGISGLSSKIALRMKARQGESWKLARFYVLTVATLAALLLTLTTYTRNRVYSSRVVFWTDVTEKRPQNPRGWVNLAAAIFEESGDVKLAIALTKKALVINPEYVGARKNLAVLLGESGDFKSANDHYQVALQSAPDDWGMQLNYADSLLQAGRYKDAISQFEKVEQGTVVNSEGKQSMWAQQAFAFANLNMPEQADNYYAKALAIDDGNATLLIQCAQFYLSQGDSPRARSLLLRASRLSEPSALVLSLLADIALNEGREKEAADLFRRSINLDPGFAPPRLSLGLMLVRAGAYREAIQVLHPLGVGSLDPEIKQEALALLILSCGKLGLHQQKQQYEHLFQ